MTGHKKFNHTCRRAEERQCPTEAFDMKTAKVKTTAVAEHAYKRTYKFI